MTKKDLFIHTGLALIAVALLILGTFYVVLPTMTNHGESMTVPNIEGMSYDELKDFLEDRDLRHEVEADSGYSPKFPPLAVLKQFPKPNSKVKQNRKIYITLNSANPPKVKMPDLRTHSLKQAQLELKSIGLMIGEIKYKPDFALNTVLEQYYKGKIIEAETMIPKGASIDFEIGDGLGNQRFTMQNLIGMNLEDAEVALKGVGLQVGDVFYKPEGIISSKGNNTSEETVNNEAEEGTIFKQVPGPATKVKVGQSVDLWVVEVDSANLYLDAPSLDIN